MGFNTSTHACATSVEEDLETSEHRVGGCESVAVLLLYAATVCCSCGIQAVQNGKQTGLGHNTHSSLSARPRHLPCLYAATVCCYCMLLLYAGHFPSMSAHLSTYLLPMQRHSNTVRQVSATENRQQSCSSHASPSSSSPLSSSQYCHPLSPGRGVWLTPHRWPPTPHLCCRSSHPAILCL
eukprot:1314898-Rhodomonas_salina.1